MSKFRIFPLRSGFAGCPVGLYLRLDHSSNGISVVVCNNNGEVVESGYLFSLLNNGTVLMYSAVSLDLGLRLDDDGHIKLSSEWDRGDTDDD